MFAFIVVLTILAIIGIGMFATIKTEDISLGIIAMVVSIVPGLLIIAFSTKLVGVCRDVSETEMIGYVANVSYGGVVWKTVEVDVYVDKNTSSVSKSFSSNDEKYYEVLKKLVGKRVKIKSKDSWVQPWSVGDSDRNIVFVEEVGEDVEKN